MIGWLFTSLGDTPVIRTTCGGCRELMTIPTVTVAHAEGVLICPNCGEREVGDRVRCETIARVLRRARNGEKTWLNLQ